MVRTAPPAPAARAARAFLLLAVCLPLLTGAGWAHDADHRRRGGAAQPDHLDVGSFTLLREGARVGREQFSLRHVGSPDGVAFELRAESAIDDRRLATRLETDSAGSPLRYTAEVRAGANVVLRLGGQRVRGRFATLARTDRGEAAREYLLPKSAVVLEVESFHQVAMAIRARMGQTDFTVRALAPMENRERDIRITLDAPTDSVTVAGVRLTATRWIVDDPGRRRVLWTDADDRVLRVTVPALGLEAIRDDVPR